MKRKFAALLLVLIMCVSVFTGCGLFTTDDKAYYEATVATITYKTGEVDKITKRELLMAYSSYGYNYVSNYGYTRKQAVNVTLETVINNHLKIKDVENYYNDSNRNTEGKKMLNDNETTYLWDSVYAALYNNLKEYYSDIITDKAASSAENSDETTTDDKSLYKDYERKVYFKDVDGKVVIMLNDSQTSTQENYEIEGGVVRNYEKTADGGIQPDREAMYNKLHSLVGDKQTEAQRNWNAAFNKYIEVVKENYSYEKFKTDEDCFKFEMDRVYKILKDNYLIEKYTAIYGPKDGRSLVTVDDVLKSYSAKVRADYTTYKNSSAISDFETQMTSNVSGMDYIMPNATEFFYVGYVKMNFDETQTKKLETLKKQNEAGSINDYETQVGYVYDSAYATKRHAETGLKTDTKINASVLREEIQNKLATNQENYQKKLAEINNNTNLTATEKEDNRKLAKEDLEKANALTLREYLYLYNDDDTLKGADFNAVFGLNRNNEIVASSTFSGNQAVLDAVKELYCGGEAQIGEVSKLVRADDGVYLFFYAGGISNLFEVTDNFDASTDQNNIYKLTGQKLNIFSNKTLFDLLYDELAGGSTADFEAAHIAYLKDAIVAKNGIKSIENNLKDLY